MTYLAKSDGTTLLDHSKLTEERCVGIAIYPTDEHPTGLPLDDIDDCEKETETTSKGE